MKATLPIQGHHRIPRDCANCTVRQFSLFGSLEGRALERVHQQVTALRVDAGHNVYSAQTTGTALYTVRTGVVRLERVNERGERRILRLAGRTDIVGLEAVLEQTYAADAVACTRVELCRIPRQLVDELTADVPQMRTDLMKRWQRALDDAEEWLAELATGPARRRMLRLLLKLSEYAGPEGEIWLPMRDEMGAMLDMTVETASRLVSALKREGVLHPMGARGARIDMTRLLQTLNAQDAL